MTPFEHDLRHQLAELRKEIDRNDPLQVEAEATLAKMVELLVEGDALSARMHRDAKRGPQIDAEMGELASRLYVLGAGKASAPGRMQ